MTPEIIEIPEIVGTHEVSRLDRVELAQQCDIDLPDEWRWVYNVASDTAILPVAFPFRKGRPQSPIGGHSPAQLIEMGMIGIYRKD